MLSNKRWSIARGVGSAVAYDLFVVMLNPKFRGSEFRWVNLEDMAARQASSSLGMQGDFGKDHNKMQEAAADYARYIIKACLKDSGVENWLPCKK
jgi:hypothetical protein